MSDTRELPIIEHEIRKLLQRAQQMKCQYEDNQELLVENEKDVYNAQKNYFTEFWKYYILNEFSIKRINQLSQLNQRMTEDIDKLEVHYPKK